MKSKAKWIFLGLLVILLVVVALLPSCGGPGLSSTRVIVMIWNYGVPYLDYYYKEAFGEDKYQASGGIGNVQTVGKWRATYQDGIWKVRGAVYTVKGDNCPTTWTFNEKTGDIHLIGFDCGPTATP